jgi:hypothetical protein
MEHGFDALACGGVPIEPRDARFRETLLDSVL